MSGVSVVELVNNDSFHNNMSVLRDSKLSKHDSSDECKIAASSMVGEI